MNKPVELKSNEMSLCAGKYLIIDPCYIFKDEEYDAICESCNFDSSMALFSLILNDHRSIVGMHTAIGDGIYPVYDRVGDVIGTCGVDSGMLAIVPEQVLAARQITDFSYGVLVELESTLPIQLLERGVVSIGYEIMIDTDGYFNDDIIDDGNMGCDEEDLDDDPE